MSIFKIILLIGTLGGVFGIDSCFFGAEQAGVTETQVIDFVESLKNEGKNPLENIAKLGELSSIAEKLKTIDGTNNEQILNEVDDEIDKLAITSPTVEAQKEELKAAARKYASADVKVISSNTGSVKELKPELAIQNDPSEPPAEVVTQIEQVNILSDVVPQVVDVELSSGTDVEKKSTTDDAPVVSEASPVEQATLTSETEEEEEDDEGEDKEDKQSSVDNSDSAQHVVQSTAIQGGSDMSSDNPEAKVQILSNDESQNTVEVVSDPEDQPTIDSQPTSEESLPQQRHSSMPDESEVESTEEAGEESNELETDESVVQEEVTE